MYTSVYDCLLINFVGYLLIYCFFLIIDLSIFYGTQISGFQWQDRWLWQKKIIQDFAGENLRSSPRHSCAGQGLSSWDVWIRRKVVWFPYLKGADVWSSGGMKCEVFCGCGSVICCSRRSQVVAFRISFECFLVGFCFVSEETSCWQPMVSLLDLFRFASVSWSYWFHFGIDNSQSPRSESGRGMCPTKHGWMAHDAAVVWCWNHSKHRNFAEWYQACFPVHPWSGDVMSLTSGQCQAEWNFGLIQICKVYIHWPNYYYYYY